MIKSLAEVTEKYGTGSVYPTGRKNKQSVDIYGVAFYYDNLEGKKTRKVITGKKKNWSKKG